MRLVGWIVLLALAHLAARGLILFNGDVTWWAPLSDETPTGNLAAALSSGGLVMPWQAYQFKPFAGGTVIEGLLAWPFFELWGDRLLALRLAPIIISLLTMLAWMLLLDRWFSRRAAVLAGCLLALPPPLYGLLSVTAWGNHTESGLLSVLALWWLLHMLGSARPRRPAAIAGFGLGLLCGFGLWFSYTFVVTLAMLLLAWSLLDPRWPRGRAFIAFWPGLLVGMIPWYLNMRFWGPAAMFSIDTYTGYAGTAYIQGSRMFLETDLSGIAFKGLRLLGYGLPRAALFPALGPLPGATFSIVFFLLSLAGAAALIYAHRSSLTNPLQRNRARALDPRLTILLFPPLFCAVLVLSGFRVEDFRLSRPQEYVNYRYLGPTLPFVFAWIAAGADSALTLLRRRRLAAPCAAALTALIVGLGLVPCLDLANVSAPRFYALKFRGSDPQLALERLAGLIGGAEMSTPTSLEALRQVPEAQAALAFEYLGAIGPPASELADKMNAQARGEYRIFLQRGLGRFQAKRLLDAGGPAALSDPCGLLASITDQTPASQYADPWFWEGVGMSLGFAAIAQPAALEQQARQLGLIDQGPAASDALAAVVLLVDVCQDGDARALERGLGRLALEAFNVMPGQSPIVQAGEFHSGVGAQLRRNALLDLRDKDVAVEGLFRTPPRWRCAAVRGWIEESMQLGVAP